MKIIAVASNYASHNNNNTDTLLTKTEPLLYSKADSSVIKDGKPFFVPNFMGTITYNMMLVVRICKLGKSIPERFAHRYYDAVTLGVDFTAQDYLKKVQEKQASWFLAKSFDGSTALGSWLNVEQFKSINTLSFNLKVDNQDTQIGYTNNMLMKVDELIAYISQFITLKTGDLLFTGSPTEANIVGLNQHFEGYIENNKVIDFYSR